MSSPVPPHHLTTNRESINNIRNLITPNRRVTFHHIYSHVKQKTKSDPNKWNPKVAAQKETLPIHYPTACKLNEAADAAADKGTKAAPSFDHPTNGYTLAKAIISTKSNSSPIPKHILKPMWRSKWRAPKPGTPTRKSLAHAGDTALYGFLLRATHNLLPTREKVHGTTPNSTALSPYCLWCQNQGLGEHTETLEHVLTTCPAHSNTRIATIAQTKLTSLALDTIPTIATNSTEDWLGIIRPPKGNTKTHLQAFNEIKTTLLTASHRMWMDRCTYLNSIGITYSAQRKTAPVPPTTVGEQAC
jgi:hypothetical protein